MDVTPQELRSNEIKDAWRGYDREEVDELLDRAAATIEGLSRQVQELSQRAAPADPNAIPTSRDHEDMLQRTLILAQRAADDAVNEAQARARQLLEESEAKAQALVSDAESTARRIAEGERRRLESEIAELSARRDTLRTDADALDTYASGYRDRLRAAIEADLASLERGATVEPPSERPVLHEVELPPAAPAPASNVSPAPRPEPVERASMSAPEASWDSGPETRSVRTVEAPPAPAGEWPPPAPSADASSGRTGTAVRDDRPQPEAARVAAAWESPAAWGSTDPEPWAAPEAAPRFASDVPMEARTVDADPLDDDAFFASLREAVRDDAPLGPRDEDHDGFFDEELQGDGRRRFRRRR